MYHRYACVKLVLNINRLKYKTRIKPHVILTTKKPQAIYNTCTYNEDYASSYSTYDDDDTDVCLISSDKYYIYIEDDEN